MTPARLNRLPEAFAAELSAARRRHGWSQAELGRRVGLPQAHVSGIETGRIVPRFDTLLDLVRVLGLDLVLVPQSLVPAVKALVRAARDPGGAGTDIPLYAAGRDEAEGEEAEDGEAGR